MRNLFDQYFQPENRLTHALVVALAEDKKLLRSFVRWVTHKPAPSTGLAIVEQQLPGEPELSENDAEQRGLPDAWIHDNDRWSLLIESKIAAAVRNDQLDRHVRTALRRGFVDITLLVIDVAEPHREGLEAQGATVVVPLEHARRGARITDASCLGWQRQVRRAQSCIWMCRSVVAGIQRSIGGSQGRWRFTSEINTPS